MVQVRRKSHLKRLILSLVFVSVGFLVASLWTAPPSVEAQNTNCNFGNCVSIAHSPIVNQANSSNVKAFSMDTQQYGTFAGQVNWPTGCTNTWLPQGSLNLVSNNLKMYPTLPKDGGTVGDFADTSSSCGSFLGQTWNGNAIGCGPENPPDDRFNPYTYWTICGAGTRTRPSGGLAVQTGAWARPDAFGGWALPGPTPANFSTPSTAPPNYLGYDPSLPDPYNACSKYGLKGIWGNQAGGTGSALLAPWPSTNPLSRGTAFFRDEFTLTQAQLDKINDPLNGLSMLLWGEDWWNMWINGVNVAPSYVRTSPMLNPNTPPSSPTYTVFAGNEGNAPFIGDMNAIKSYLHVGVNTLAIQVMTKVVMDRDVYYYNSNLNLNWEYQSAMLCYNLMLVDNGPSIACSGTLFTTPSQPVFGQPFEVSVGIRNSSPSSVGNITVNASDIQIKASWGGSVYWTGTANAPPSSSIGVGSTTNFTTGAVIPTPGVGPITITYSVTANSGGSTLSTGQCPPLTVTAIDLDLPYLQVFGGDVRAGSTFDTTGGVCNLMGGGTINTERASNGGSGSQFAAIAAGNITEFATAMLRTTGPVLPDGLTFANNSTPAVGNLGNNNCISESSRWNDVTTPSTQVIGNSSYQVNRVGSETGSNIGINPTGNQFHLMGGTVPLNSGIKTLYVDGDVRISSNITYAVDPATGGWSSISQIPQFSLVARGNIYIDKDVTNLDGMYIATPRDDNNDKDPDPGTGIIYTCANNFSRVPESAMTNPASGCTKQLTINGAFAANKIHFNRLFGTVKESISSENPFSPIRPCKGGSKSVCAAEVFVMSPESYLPNIAPNPSASILKLQYDYVSSLQPIF